MAYSLFITPGKVCAIDPGRCKWAKEIGRYQNKITDGIVHHFNCRIEGHVRAAGAAVWHGDTTSKCNVNVLYCLGQ